MGMENQGGAEKTWCVRLPTKPVQAGTEFRSDNTKHGSAAYKVYFTKNMTYTHTHELSEAWDKNQGLFNGAHETSKVWEYQQKCRNLILPGHKVTRKEAADDRQLNWKGRHLLGIRCLFILSTKNDVLSSKYTSYWRYNEGFPKAERHVKEGVPKGVSTLNRAAEVVWACFWQPGGYAGK